MLTAGRLAGTAGVFLLYVVAFGLIGGIVSFVFEVIGDVSMEGFDAVIFYVLWCVLGIFCGLLGYDAGGKFASPGSVGDWTGREDAGKTGLVVVLTESVLLLALFVPCYLWASGRLLTFFVTVFVSIMFGHFKLRPKPALVKPAFKARTGGGRDSSETRNPSA
jgi:hypothetical protein